MQPVADELTDAQREELRATLLALRGELEQTIEDARDGTKPVDLDEPIGRLSRMDAMQQQQMAQAAKRGAELRLARVTAALARLEVGEYGDCLECEEPIGYRRLSARPEARRCLACQSARE